MSSISIGEAHAGATRAAPARRVRTHEGPEPWSRRDALLVALILAVALAGLVVGWLGVSDTVDLNSQTRWLGLGIGALIVGGFGMVAWLLLGLRRIAVLRREVLTVVDRRHPEPARVAARPQLSDRQGFGTVPGMRRYHAPDCQLLAGKDAQFAPAAAHAEAGLRPCPICIGEADAT
jgi:ABC-type nickel/cobalt efflux system permease component RcnA